MKKQFLLAMALLGVVVAAIVWVRLDRAKVASADGSRDTVAIAPDGERPAPLEHPGPIPHGLEYWIEGTLWRSGLLESHRDSFLSDAPYARTRLWVDSSGSQPVWTVDLSGLDISVLGHDTALGDPGMEEGFQARLLIAGTRLCREEDRHAGFPGWSLSGEGSLRCGPNEGRKSVRSWFRERFGREPGASEVSEDQGKVSLDISCRGKDAVGALGRLGSVDFGRVRLTGCALSSGDALLLGSLRAARLELVDLKSEILPLGRARISERLLVQGGNVRWLELPKACRGGKTSCDQEQSILPPGLSVEVRDLPLCGKDATADLARLSVEAQGSRCQEIPLDMIARRDSLDQVWTSLVGEDPAQNLLEATDTIDLQGRPSAPGRKDTWKRAVGTASTDECSAGSYPKDSYILDEFGAKGRILDSYFEGASIQITYKGKKIRAGMTREELIAILGRPTLDREGFLAWTVSGTCDGRPANLRAHFDAQGKLDAWIDRVEPECGGC